MEFKSDLSDIIMENTGLKMIFNGNLIAHRAGREGIYIDKAPRLVFILIFVKFNQKANTGTAMLSSGDPGGLSF